jgi:hypothetical protein
MEVMCLIAVLVNCALIGLSGQVHRMFPEMSTTQTILLIVALEVRLNDIYFTDDVPVKQEFHTYISPHIVWFLILSWSITL